jgi:hypothetical protein
MTTRNRKHWGEWARQRAAHAGFRLQVDLAQKLGCSHEQVSRWFGMESPPSTMRKGFDVRLAEALCVPREMLFVNWLNVSPDSLPVANAEPNQLADETTLRRKLLAIVELLDPAQLGQLHDKGRELLSTHTDQRQAVA